VCEANPEHSLYVSMDSGENWTALDNTQISGFNLTALAVDPHNAQTIWVASPANGLYASTDSGSTWKQVSSLHNVLALAVDPRRSTRLYAGTFDNGLYASVDGGRTWQRRARGMEPNEYITSLVVDPVRPNVVYAASGRSGVYVSEDYGDTWRLLNDRLTMRAVNILTITPDGLNLFAGSLGQGVFRLSTHDQAYFDELAAAAAAVPSQSAPAANAPASSAAAPIIATAVPSTQAPFPGWSIALIAAVVLAGLAFLMFRKRA
jgi:photosystem II stability/assembly factor-like uncharacterized protein